MAEARVALMEGELAGMTLIGAQHADQARREQRTASEVSVIRARDYRESLPPARKTFRS